MSTGQSTMRAGRADDIEHVLALWARARSGRASVQDSADALERLLGDRPGALLVAELDGHVVGALIATSDGWRGNMYRLAVDPAHRRRGIARALVRAGELRLHAGGTRRITALVAHDDEVACGLWRAAGYDADREIGRFVRNL
ncbi:MAG TPA: GNAT family N-acetyltransferase [Conexibacter sp.]|jgi:ribosomal protein S18 acetylase RimI-like enzyme|nr:GNAT family N-acetyltransferase [Conexibacter sp.]